MGDEGYKKGKSRFDLQLNFIWFRKGKGKNQKEGEIESDFPFSTQEEGFRNIIINILDNLFSVCVQRLY